MPTTALSHHDWETGCLSVPNQATMQALRQRFTARSYSCDVFVAYLGVPTLQLAGFLVTYAGEINKPLAFCPISNELVAASALWRRELRRQRDIADQIAMTGKLPAGIGSIDLSSVGMKPWLFALACVRITREAEEALQYPRPFCPDLFLAMARQPRARQWLLSSKIETKESVSPRSKPHLSPRQCEVLSALQGGMSERQIGQLLSVSQHTVHTYVKSIYRVFNVSSRGELLARFIQPN